MYVQGVRRYCSDLEPVAVRPFDDSFEKDLYSVTQVKGNLLVTFMQIQVQCFNTFDALLLTATQNDCTNEFWKSATHGIECRSVSILIRLLSKTLQSKPQSKLKIGD
jgi:hypothetical protein